MKNSRKTRKKSNKNTPSPSIDQLKEAIENLIRRPKLWGYSSRTVMRELNLKNKIAKEQVEEILEELLEEGVLYLNEDGRFKSNEEQPTTTIGILDLVNPNYGFVICENYEKDIWIDADNMGNALDGDTVRVAIYDIYQPQKPEGEIIEVIQRKRDEFVGTIQLSKNHAFVVPDYKKMYVDIYVPIDQVGTAQDREKVLVKIKEWHKMGKKPIGFIKQVLGKAGEHQTEMHAIMAEYGLPFDFPSNVQKAASKIDTKISPEEITNRRDFRNITTFTIDPEDAKDFDDALSIKKLENGHWEIGVHIADVSHYVLPNTILDKEAFNRATSVYLVDRVVPMLPEKLSNHLCSLRPHEDKLTFSAVFELNEKAQVISEWFGRTVIHSNRRFTYEEAQERIETSTGDYAQEILTLHELAQYLTQERLHKGAISFETLEVRFKLDEKGFPLAVIPKIRKDAHKLIEEFMLLANKRVAEYVFNLQKRGKPKTMVYRIHESPDSEKIKTYAKFVERFGYKIETQGKKMSYSFNKMAQQMEGKPEQNILQSLAVRTMSKAKYSTEPKGHFGLAFDHYTHFTSPIRRYPDVMAHRLLQYYLEGGKSVNIEQYEERCEHSSEMERRAAEAERASIKYKQVEFMQLRDDGRVWEGIVTGVTEFGIYVEIIETKCEGMVRMSDIEDDYYELDAQNYRVIGKRTGNIIAFGDQVQIKVKDISLPRRIIDLVFANSQGTSGTAKKSGTRRSTKTRNKETGGASTKTSQRNLKKPTRKTNKRKK